MKRFPLNRCDGIFRFKRSWGHRTVCVALCRFSSFFITTSKTKSPFCLYMGVVVWGDILFRGASYIVSDGMSATTGTNIRRMYAVAKMYVLKLSKSLVNSKYGFNPLICFLTQLVVVSICSISFLVKLGLLSFSHFYSGVLTPFLRRSNEKTFNPFKTAVSGCSRAADTRIKVLLWLPDRRSRRTK